MVCIPVVDMDYIPGNSLCSEMHRSMNPNLKKIELFIQKNLGTHGEVTSIIGSICGVITAVHLIMKWL